MAEDQDTGPTIQDILFQAKDRLRTWEALSDLMPIDPATGLHSPGVKMLSKLANEGPKTLPHPDTITRLRHGLNLAGINITDGEILAAYARSFKIRLLQDEELGPLVILLGERGRRMSWDRARAVAKFVLDHLDQIEALEAETRPRTRRDS